MHSLLLCRRAEIREQVVAGNGARRKREEFGEVLD
jgi:hypothetical protein